MSHVSIWILRFLKVRGFSDKSYNKKIMQLDSSMQLMIKKRMDYVFKSVSTIGETYVFS
jgi:hypothetical protein